MAVYMSREERLAKLDKAFEAFLIMGFILGTIFGAVTVGIIWWVAT